MELKRTTPGKAGIAPRAILDFVDAVDREELGLHSFMLLRHGEVASEGWWAPYAPEKKHMLFSLSKSFTSMAVGFAIREGRFSLDDTVLSFFQDEFDIEPCENMRRMTVRHLLTMNTGHDAEPDVFGTPNWAYAFLTSFVARRPGSLFVYNTPATYMLSCIVQKTTGQKLMEYLTPRLFEPLGIQGATWEESPQGVNTGGFGLNLATEDIARFGQMLLSGGCVDGLEIVDPEWVKAATSRQVPNGDPADMSDWSQGYGYQFWRCRPEGVFRGDGAYGQYCIVMPKQDACLAMTSGTNNMGRILALVWEKLLPAMGGECADVGLDELNARLKTLSIRLPEGEKNRADEKALSGRYVFGDNPLNFRSAKFDFFGELPKFELEFANPSGSGEPVPEVLKSEAGFGEWKKVSEDILCAYAWQNGELLIRLLNEHAPFAEDVKVKFCGDYLETTTTRNVQKDKPFRVIGKKE